MGGRHQGGCVEPEQLVDRHVGRAVVGRTPGAAGVFAGKHTHLGGGVDAARVQRAGGHRADRRFGQGAPDAGPGGSAVGRLPEVGLAVTTEANVHNVGVGRVDVDGEQLAAGRQCVGAHLGPGRRGDGAID